MGSSPEEIPVVSEWATRLVRAVQIVAGGVCLLLYSQLYRGVPNEEMFTKLHFEFYFFDLWPAIPLYLLGIVALVTPWKKVGLALTAGAALALFVCVEAMFRRYLGGDFGQWPKVYFMLLVMLQIALFALSAAIYWMGRHENQSVRLLLACLAAPAVFLGSSAAFGPFVTKGPQRHLDAVSASAVESMHKLNSALQTYASSHQRTGYPASLEELGPWKAGLVDDLLATGLKRGYSFNYRAGPAEAGGRVTTFTLNARPMEYWGTGLYSYFMDQTGVIRKTNKDRAANERDPALGP